MKRLPIGWAALLLALLSILVLVFSALYISRGTPPGDPITPIDLVVQARRAGRPLQALYHVEALAAESGWTPELLRIAGDVWRDAGSLPRAVDFWEAAAQANPKDPVLARGLAQAYIDLQRWSKAADALERMLALNERDYWAQLQLGLIRAPFDPRKALTHLEAAAEEPAYQQLAWRLSAILRDDPGDPLLSMRIGVVLAEQELWNYAELAFQQAAIVNAPYAEALAYTGLARDAQGKDGKAWLDEAVALEPDSAQVRYLQGLHFRRIGADDASIGALAQAVQLDPANPAFNAELGTAYNLVGDTARAEYWLRLAALFSNGDPHFEGLLQQFYDEQASMVDGLGEN